MEVMEMDLSTFCATTHRIKIQFSDFFGMFTGSYQEAMLSDFYIDED